MTKSSDNSGDKTPARVRKRSEIKNWESEANIGRICKPSSPKRP